MPLNPDDFDLQRVRPHRGSRNLGFEELCTQLLSLEPRPPDARFYRKGGSSDGGVEAYVEFANGNQHGLQAKFYQQFSSDLSSKLTASFKEAIDNHPGLVRYVVCVPFNLRDGQGSSAPTELARWKTWREKAVARAKSQGVVSENGKNRTLSWLQQPKRPELARADLGAAARYSLSVKRTLSGQSGRLSDNALINEFSDIKIAGQDNGQKGLAMALIGYARVSTAEQDTALQTDALRKAGCERVFEDVVSGAKADRPGLAASLAYLRDGDVLAVWRLDRLGRSLPHLIETIGALEARGVGFRSLTESIDTTTSGGRLIFHVFGALGQFERDLIRDRTKAGLTAAAARGRKGGRKPVVTAEKLQRAQEHIANGLNVREAATRLKVSKTALYAALQAAQAAQT